MAPSVCRKLHRSLARCPACAAANSRLPSVTRLHLLAAFFGPSLHFGSLEPEGSHKLVWQALSRAERKGWSLWKLEAARVDVLTHLRQASSAQRRQLEEGEPTADGVSSSDAAISRQRSGEGGGGTAAACGTKHSLTSAPPLARPGCAAAASRSRPVLYTEAHEFERAPGSLR